MPKATLQITKYAGVSPAIAACTSCGRQFKTPLTRLQKVADAMASLQEQFERHICRRAAVEGQWERNRNHQSSSSASVSGWAEFIRLLDSGMHISDFLAAMTTHYCSVCGHEVSLETCKVDEHGS